MEEEKITPEEKLLKIIESPQKNNPFFKTFPKRFYKRKIFMQAIDIKGISERIKNLRINKNTIRNFKLAGINKIILVLCGIFTFYCIFDYLKLGGNLNRRFTQIVAEAAVSDIKEKKVSLPQINISETLTLARRRNMFTFIPPLPAAGQIVMPPDLAQIISSLKLVGIIWSANPQAMIEDSKEQKTYLLNTGDQISTIKIKKILRDRVILGKDDQEWELR
jgi:type II secretory pathway component PulC